MWSSVARIARTPTLEKPNSYRNNFTSRDKETLSESFDLGQKGKMALKQGEEAIFSKR